MLIVSEVRILGWSLGIFNNFFAGWKPAVQVQGLNFFWWIMYYLYFCSENKNNIGDEKAE